MKHPIKLFISFIILLFFLPAFSNQAQEEELVLRLRRNFGYGGSGEIQGLFTMIAEGSEALTRVTFYIDDQVIGEDQEAPFQVQFSTDSYPLGMHSLRATGFTENGDEFPSNSIEIEFVSAEAGWKAGIQLVVPILVILAIVVGVGILLTVITSKKRMNPAPGTPRKYGFSGGSICPKCSRPTPIHFMGLNLGTKKYDRCENCGKWSLMQSIPLAKLRQAEAEELTRAALEENQASANLHRPEEKLRKELDDSRYLDS
jgi:hypothetical protein